MRRATVRLGMSLMVTLGLWTSSLPAQEPSGAGVDQASLRQRQQAAQQGCNSPNCNNGANAGNGANKQRPAGPFPLVRGACRAINHFYLNDCYATHDTIGCDSLHGNLMFVFGSCRTFYGEACARPPQPPQMQPYGSR